MLYLNKIPIPVEKNFSVRMNWVNPCCYFDKIRVNAGLGIEIPVNEYTRAIFGNPERFEQYSQGNDRKFPGFEISKSNLDFEQGVLVITSATSKSYSAWLQPYMGAFGEEQKDKFINQMAWKTDVKLDAKAEYVSGTDDYCLAKIKNPLFWEGKGKYGYTQIPFYNQDNELKEREEYANFLNEELDSKYSYEINFYDNTDPGQAEDNSARVISPFLFFRYALKELFRMNGFYISDHPFNSITGIDNLVIYNNFNVFDPAPKVTSDVVFKEFNRRANNYSSVAKERIDNIEWALANFKYADLIPKIALKDFLLSIQNWINIAFIFKPGNTISIIDRDAVMGDTPVDVTKYQIGDWDKGEQKQVSIKFVQEYDKNDANFADEFHDLTDRWTDFKAPVESYSDLLLISSRHNPDNDRTIGQIRLVKDENKYYEFKVTVHKNEDENQNEDQVDVLAWEYISSGPQYYVFRNGDKIEEIKTNISTLQKEDGKLTALQKGNVNAMRNNWSDFSFRMFYYVTGSYGDTFFGNSSCNWEGDNGLFNRRWKKWTHFWANRLPVEGEFDFPLQMVYYIKNNIHRKFKTEKGAFIIEEMSVDIGLNYVGTTKIKGYKI